MYVAFPIKSNKRSTKLKVFYNKKYFNYIRWPTNYFKGVRFFVYVIVDNSNFSNKEFTFYKIKNILKQILNFRLHGMASSISIPMENIKYTRVMPMKYFGGFNKIAPTSPLLQC